MNKHETNIMHNSNGTDAFPTNNHTWKTLYNEECSYLLYNILIPSFGVIIVVANLAVVISSCLMFNKGKAPKTIYLLLGNIAFADLLTGIGLIFGQTFPSHLINHEICTWEIGFILSNVLVSLYCNFLIALDRFLYILYGLYYQRWFRPRGIFLVIILLWISGCFLGYLPLMGWSGDTNNGKTCWFVSVVPKQLIITTVIISMIPLLCWIFLYSIIAYRSFNNISETLQQSLTGKLPASFDQQKSDQSNRNIFRKKFSTSVNSSKRWKAIKLSFFTTSSFAITWFPYMIVSLYYLSICDNNIGKKCRSLRLVLTSPLAVLGFVNSLLNPIIYAWWYKGFNKFIRRVSTFKLRNPNQNRRDVLNTNYNCAVNPMLDTKKQKLYPNESLEECE